jgi:hypothetical protein
MNRKLRASMGACAVSLAASAMLVGCAPVVIGGGSQDTPEDSGGVTAPSVVLPTTPEYEDWTAHKFNDDVKNSPCDGDRYVRFDEGYGLYVGVALCSPTRYKIFLGASPDGVFQQIGDFAGHGQDHCELVNPTFAIPDEDDIKSGGCAACQTSVEGGEWYLNPTGTQGYSRATFGDPFEFVPVWPEYNLYTASWYECGVAIP